MFFQASRSTQRTMFAPAKLTVVTVYNKLKDIALMTGHSVRIMLSCVICYAIVRCVSAALNGYSPCFTVCKSQGGQSEEYVCCMSSIWSQISNKVQRCSLYQLFISLLLYQLGNQTGQLFFRSLAGKLRIGLAEQTVLTALAHAVVLTPPSNGEWPASCQVWMIKPGLFLIVLFNQISLQRFLMPVKVYLLRISRKPSTRLLCV
jgi:hypothetical protein